jgi:predicted nucleic acid-binding protein
MRLSLADAVGFAVIRELSLDGAFAFDRDFPDCGFTMYPSG